MSKKRGVDEVVSSKNRRGQCRCYEDFRYDLIYVFISSSFLHSSRLFLIVFLAQQNKSPSEINIRSSPHSQ